MRSLWEQIPGLVRLLATLSLFYSLSLNRIELLHFKVGTDGYHLRAPAPPAGLSRRVCLPGGRRLGAAGGGHLARTLQDGGGPVPRWPPSSRDSMAFFGISENRCSPTFARPCAAPGTVLHASWRTGCPARLSLAAGLPRGGGLLPARAPRSLLVVIGGVGKGKFQAVGLGQQQADVPVPPVGRGQVLQEEQQLLKISFF